MKILAVETTTSIESVALYNDGEIMEVSHEVKSHSASLLKTIDGILKESKIKLKDLDGLAVSIGPGSFTGIRIGLSTMQGLSLALNIPLIGVPTLDSLAENIMDSGLDLNNVAYVCPIILSKGEDVYTAIYANKKNGFKRIGEYYYISINGLLEIFRKDKKSGDIIFLGDTQNFRNTISDVLGKKASFLSDDFSSPRASRIALIAGIKIKKKRTKKIVYPSPLYVREFLINKALK